MIPQFMTWVRGVISKMLHMSEAKRAFSVEVAIGDEMQAALELWTLLFQDKAPWLDRNTQSLGLPSSIAGELARLVTVELKSEVTGSPRADFLQAEYQVMLDQLRAKVEVAVAAGGLVFKPYVDGGHIAVDCVPAWRFLPTGFNSRGEVTGAVFVEQTQKGKHFYTRMEQHRLDNGGYVIRNLAFQSLTPTELGAPCDLSAVDEWADLAPELTVRQRGSSAVDRVLFAYFKMPFANHLDTASPLGVSAYSRAVSLIEQADKQYSRILWEYEGSELAIDASDFALKTSLDGSKNAIPERRKRLFRGLNIDPGGDGDLYKVFSPEIRDTSLFHGLDQLLKRIEFNCYLSYGTLSDPQVVEKTAEEIKSSRQRSYSAVCDIQKSLQKALEHLVWIMDFYASLYKLTPPGAYQTAFTWGDGVMENTEVEFVRRKALVDGGYLKPEALMAWYFGVSEEDAAKLMPTNPPALFDEG